MVGNFDKTALIVGTYNGLNKGDRLMQQVIIQQLKDQGIEPVLSTPFPDVDKTLYNGTKVKKCGRRNLFGSLFFCCALALMPYRLRRVLSANVKELNDYVVAEFVVDASGDMLTEDYGPHVAFSHLVPLIYSTLLKKNFVVLAQSIGPFKWLGWLFDYVLQQAKYITTRDEITYRYLQSRGYSNLLQVADLGFLLSPISVQSSCTDGWDREDQEKVVIGICPSALFLKKFSKNLSVESISDMLRRIAKELNLLYVFVPHVQTPNGKMDDAKLSSEIVNLLSKDAVVLDSSLSPAEVKYMISKFDGMVSFRMHAAIAALDSYVPTIAVSYSHKTIGLFEKLNLKEWVVRNEAGADVVSNIEQRIRKLVLKRDELVQHLRLVIPDIREEAKKNLKVLKEME